MDREIRRILAKVAQKLKHTFLAEGIPSSDWAPSRVHEYKAARVQSPQTEHRRLDVSERHLLQH